MLQDISEHITMDMHEKLSSDVALIFPHQLFKSNPVVECCEKIFLIEEYLFFNQFNFHKRKIAFHRASMKAYEAYLLSNDKDVSYVEAKEEACDIRVLLPQLGKRGVNHIHYIDTVDDWLEKRIRTGAAKINIAISRVDSPSFLNTENDLKKFFKKNKKKFFQTKFYIDQRKKLDILMDGDGPLGGKWSFDAENRKKYPRGKSPPEVKWPSNNDHYTEAKEYVDKYFSDNLGDLNDDFRYPIDFRSGVNWLEEFLHQRFAEFGDFEDAIVPKESILNHSVLSPLINVGLITPGQLLSKTLKTIDQDDIPVNSAEGFIRQIIGWREFIRGIYITKGAEERTRNFWGFDRKIPSSFYSGETGIKPFDDVVKKVLYTGYCHHIERLMILGNFMLLCEFDPDEVYRWFMELFIDSYDWVMVPNVYGMSQYADGGLMSSKPYISGSNYVLKMSNYKKDTWCEVWDALFWRFIHIQRGFFSKNPRMKLLLSTFDRMSDDKQNHLMSTADEYLASLG